MTRISLVSLLAVLCTDATQHHSYCILQIGPFTVVPERGRLMKQHSVMDSRGRNFSVDILKKPLLEELMLIE